MSDDYGTVEERVARGVEWLDDNVENWWSHVEIMELDMRRGCNCVLGQVFQEKPNYVSGYDWAIMNFAEFGAYGSAAQMGFDADVVHNDDDEEDYKRLQEVWSRVIDERQSR